MNLQALPLEERPRERLLLQGAGSLSLIELLAIILGTGTKKKSVLEVSRELIERFGQSLLDASIEELCQVEGVGQAKAIQLKAAFALVQRLSQGRTLGLSLETPAQIFELLGESLSAEKQELLLVVLKDIKKRLISIEKVSVGTLSEVLVHPREVFYPAVRHKAYSLVVVHNHPSGDPTPSQKDLQLTRLLVQSAQLMGIPLDDHIVIGGKMYYSFRERGLLN